MSQELLLVLVSIVIARMEISWAVVFVRIKSLQDSKLIAWAHVERAQILGYYAEILPKCPPLKLYARS